MFLFVLRAGQPTVFRESDIRYIKASDASDSSNTNNRKVASNSTDKGTKRNINNSRNVSNSRDRSNSEDASNRLDARTVEGAPKTSRKSATSRTSNSRNASNSKALATEGGLLELILKEQQDFVHGTNSTKRN
jgi:hypothetical protein